MADIRRYTTQLLNYSDPTYGIEMLNQQFVGALTKEDCTSFPQMGPELPKTAPLIGIKEKVVKKLLEGLNTHTASRPDEISPRFLKEMAPSIAPALALIFQTSRDLGQVPEDWKKVNITPLFKKGDKSKAANYRPVSLTATCSKITL